ncbi:hypothetical protein F5883DRAFT_638541 [Diaporthe sp. PMI_573]|nr:hypothetical protein F5883DRAFT_638541 [Diaporthaceae sp. PMI_573]
MGFTGKVAPSGERLKRDQSIFVVQSVSTGELFANKLIEAAWDPTTLLSLPPLELRVSTYRHAIGDPNIDIPGINGNDSHRKWVLPNVPYFNKLRFWQELDPQDPTSPNCTVYSLFYEFCNGGTVRQLMDNYNEQATAIPEHFIWLVAEQLFLALVSMNFGGQPTPDDEDDGDDRSRHGSESDDSNNQPNNWARIYHRDLHAANVFINYPPRGPGRTPRAGLESNAFPEIVLGDFGNSGIQDEDLAIIPVSAYGAPVGASNDNEGSLEEWEDIFSVGELLREMSMTHIPHTGFNDMRPADRWVQDVNREGTAPPYSAELIELLQRFEYPDMMRLMVRDLLEAVHTTFPSPEDLRDILLPQAQAQVVSFRKPANRPAGYYNNMDVSWTKPEQLMPFSYIMRYATEAGDGPDGGPPSEQDGGDSDGDQGESGSGDDGEDRNAKQTVTTKKAMGAPPQLPPPSSSSPATYF